MKKTSLLLAFLMIVQLIFVASPVMASTTVAEGYTPMAISYSSEKDVYVMAAKNLTEKTMKVYTSKDGVEWTLTKDFSSANTQQNNNSQQILVYWESQKVFALAVGNYIYTSSDGVTWTQLRKFGNPIVIAADENNLYAGWYGKTAVYTSLTEYTDNAVTNDYWVYCITPDPNGYFAIHKDTKWGGYRWYISENADGTYTVTRFNATVKDAYGYSVADIKGKGYAVITIVDSPKLIVTKTSAASRSEVTINVNVDGETVENTENINSVLYSDGKIFAATVKGSIYYADVSSAAPTNDTVWNKVADSNAEDVIYTMTEGKNGTILAVGANATYAIVKDNSVYTKIDVTAPVISFANNDFIEAPSSGEAELEIKPVLKKYTGDPFNGSAEVTAVGSLPDGVTFTQGVLKVSSNVRDAATVTLKATSGTTGKNITITILVETGIKINGEEKIVIPDYGSEADTYPYTCEILNQNGGTMAKEGVLEAVSLPENVTFDSASGTLTVPYNAQAGTAVIKATSKSNSAISTETEVVLEINEPDRAEIDESLETFKVSSDSNTVIPLIGRVYNKTDDLMSSNILKWTVTDLNGNEISGVTVDNDAKTVTFEAGFSESIVLIRAEAIGCPDVYSEVLGFVLFSDEKIAEEDLKNVVSQYNFTGLENDVTLISEGKFGSDISWSSSDTNVITNSGVINANGENKSASMTVTVRYGDEVLTYVFPVSLSKYTDRYNEAVEAVEAAEASQLKADSDYANSLISQLVNSAEKTALLNRISAISLTEYEEIDLGAYSFVSSAYNKTGNILTVVAKDFTNDSNPARIYTTLDGGATWKLALSVENAKNGTHNDTKQVITYWENQNAFVAALGSNIYSSSDGLSWTEITELKTTNAYIVSNGDKLFVAGARKGKAAEDLSGAYKEIDSGGDDNYYSHYITASESGFGFYQQLSTSATYKSSSIICQLDDATNEYVATKYYPAPIGLVSDVRYVPEIEKWLITTSSSASYRFLTEPNTFTSAKTVTDDSETSGYTTALYDYKKLYIANKEGKIFVGDASDVAKVKSWQEITYETPLDSEAATMQKLANGDILVFSQKDIYTISNNILTQKQKNHKIGFNEALRIEVPLRGEKTYSFTAYSKLYDGSETTYKIASVKPKTALPDGIIFKSYDYVDDKTPVCEFKVSDYTKGGEKIILSVTTDIGITKEFEISVVTENMLSLGGKALITIPMSGDDSEVYTYSPAVLGQDGEPLDREIEFTVMSMPENITFSENSKSFTLTSESGEGIIVLKAASKTLPSLNEIYKITVEPRRLAYIAFDDASDISVVIPDSGSVNKDVAAYIYDQADVKLKAPVIYTVTDEDGNIKENVTAANGSLSVSSSAYEGSAKITVSSEDGLLKAERKLSLSYTDNRKLIEDYNYIVRINSFSQMETNASFPVAGLYGSQITYKSSNNSVIDENGTITRDYTRDTSAILTITLTLNEATLRKTVNVIVLKEDNIVENGDVETGTTSGWNGDSLTVTNDSNGGSYALNAPSGASQNATLDADRTYAVVAYVKSSVNGNASLSVNGDKLSEISLSNTYTKLDGVFTLSKNSDGNTTVSLNGTNLVIDDLIMFEITSEYTSLLNLIQTAEATKTQAAVDAAKTALASFYDLSIKNELLTRINNISITSGNGGSTTLGGGGGGGGGGSWNGGTKDTVITPATPTTPVPDYSNIVEYSSLTFKDLYGHWAKEDVEFMATAGFIKGKAEGMFDPDAYITRAEFTALIVRTMGLTEKAYENSFFDVVSEDWFSGNVQIARDMGYVMGANGLFRPNDLITREEMTKMIVSAYNKKNNKKLESGKAVYYSDIYKISSWAYDYIAQDCDEGLVNGMTETTFEPKAQATRAQAAVMLKRMYDKITAE